MTIAPERRPSSRPALLQAALNGSRRLEEHPAVPLTSHDLASAAAEAVAAGAGTVHVHVRDPSGAESVAAADVARALAAMRTVIPGVPIGVSTSARIAPDPDRRQRMVAGWTDRPDYASVNFHEPGAEPLAELLLSQGVGIEAGVATVGATERLAMSGLAPRCVRVLLEPQAQELAAALGAVAEIESVLGRAGIGLPILLHGVDRTAWPLIAEAVARAYDTRIGFEDTLTLPDGSMAASNTVLVTEARRMIAASGLGA